MFDLSKRNPVLSEEAGSTFFIGNLPSNTRIMELKKLFAKYGIIYKVKLKQKKIRTPKQSNENGGVAAESETVNAIIKFKTLKSSEAVLNMNGILYKDHHLRVTLSKDKPNIEKEKSVFVGNLAFSKFCFLNSFLLNKYKKLKVYGFILSLVVRQFKIKFRVCSLSRFPPRKFSIQNFNLNLSKLFYLMKC